VGLCGIYRSLSQDIYGSFERYAGFWGIYRALLQEIWGSFAVDTRN
jgi:hypothetical protein